MRRFITMLAASLLVGSLAAGATTAAPGIGPASDPRALLCANGGYLTLTNEAGVPFSSQRTCASYAMRGGVLGLPVALVMPDAFSPQNRAFIAEVGRARYRIDSRVTTDFDAETAQVEDLIAAGSTKVLILVTWDGTAAAPLVEAARDAGILVIAYDRPVRDTDALALYTTFDHLAVGALQARFLIDQAGATTGNDLYLYSGPAWDENSFAFLEGAWELLQPTIAAGVFVVRDSPTAASLALDHPTLTREEATAVIAEIDTEWNRDVARDQAATDLDANPPDGIAYVLAPNDHVATGIKEALEARFIEYRLTGQDAAQEWVQRLIDGGAGMTVFKDPRPLAAKTIGAAVDYLLGRVPVAGATYFNGAVEVPTIEDPVVLVTRESIQATLIDTGRYTIFEFEGTWPNIH